MKNKYFYMNSKDIQPSQLFINQEKLEQVQSFIESCYEPIPIRKISDKVVYTDGHTRAYALFLQGIDEVKVYWDKDELDLVGYKICVDWCLSENIKSISDLKHRIIPSHEYEIQWIERCKEVFMKNHILEPTLEEIEIIKELFLEYQNELNVDLCFQDFQAELDSLPGKYAAPKGRMYIARVGGEVAGCIALRPVSETACEMKRLYVRDSYRGLGLGRKLATKIIKDAREYGYSHMLLDTLTTLTPAIGLYKSLGFYEVDSYYENPLDTVVYLQLDLTAHEQ